MLLVLFLVRLAIGFQFQSIASISSHLANELGLSYAEIGSLIGLFLLPGIAIAIPSGVMTRAVTDKVLLTVGALAMIAGALVMGLGADADSFYAGRIITGIGGAIFNLVLTKMVTDWFAEREVVTALSIMLTAWPIGISLGLLTQGPIADSYGWPWVVYATGLYALVALLLSITLYRDPPNLPRYPARSLRLGLPRRELVHVSVVGIAWAFYNTSFIVVVSFTPDLLVGLGYERGVASSVTSFAMWAMLISVPFGGGILEATGRVTAPIVLALALASAVMMGLSQGMAPEFLCPIFGIVAGIPAGALMALSAEAASPDNRGPALGIFYTWYYCGMTVGPIAAGWSWDVSGNVSTPVLFGAALLVAVILLVGIFRILQMAWPIESTVPPVNAVDPVNP
jgi:MFS family permease